jgi:hypothetical protein
MMSIGPGALLPARVSWSRVCAGIVAICLD